jgi:hypothetical protein
MGEITNAYKVLIKNVEGRDHSEQVGIDSIRMYLREIVLDVLHWMHLALYEGQWRAFVNTAMNSWGS